MKSSGSKSKVDPVVLITGAEKALVEREIRSVRDRLSKLVPDAEQTRISAKEYTKGEMASLVSYSLFSEERIVSIDNVGDPSEAFETDFLEYIKDPVPGVWMILDQSGGSKGLRITRAVKAAGYSVTKCDLVKSDRDKAELVKAEVRDAGGTITAHAVDDLVAAIRDDLMGLLSSARQLVSDSGGAVTEEHVRTFFRGRVEARPFEVSQALADGDGVRAFLLVRQALATGVSPVPIVAALAKTFRGLALAKVPGLPEAEFGMQAWQMDRARRSSRRWSDDALGKAIKAIADADLDVKGRSRDPESAVELCITRVSRAFHHG